MKDIVWRPSPEVVERARVTDFMRRHGIRDYEELAACLDLIAGGIVSMRLNHLRRVVTF